MAVHHKHTIRLKMDFAFQIEDISEEMLKRYGEQIGSSRRLSDPRLIEKVTYEQELLQAVFRKPANVRFFLLKRLQEYFDGETCSDLDETIVSLCKSQDPGFDETASVMDAIEPHTDQLSPDARAYFEAPEGAEGEFDDLIMRTDILRHAVNFKLTDAHLTIG